MSKNDQKVIKTTLNHALNHIQTNTQVSIVHKARPHLVCLNKMKNSINICLDFQILKGWLTEVFFITCKFVFDHQL